MNFSRYSTHLGLVGMAALWGASWPWGRIVAQTMPPLAAASLRFLLASAVLLLWLYRSGRKDTLHTLNARQWAGLSCASAVGVLGYSIFFFFSPEKRTCRQGRDGRGPQPRADHAVCGGAVP